MNLEIPGEITEQIIQLYLHLDTCEKYFAKRVKVASICKAWRDYARKERFNDIMVGDSKDFDFWHRTLYLNSSNVASINDELAWTEKNKVPIRYFSSYISTLRYNDSVELIKLLSNTEPTNRLNLKSLKLSINNEFVRNAPASYLDDLASFLGRVKSVTMYINHDNMNTLRFHSVRALETIRKLQVSLEEPLHASENYVSNVVNDIAKCKNCSELYLGSSWLISSISFRKLTMQFTSLSIDGCELLTDNDFAWLLTSNQASLIFLYVGGASCALNKTLKALRQCTQVKKCTFLSSCNTPVPFSLISRATKGMKKLQRLKIRATIYGASVNALLDLYLTSSRGDNNNGGLLNEIEIEHCIDLNDYSTIRRRLIDAYKSSSDSILMYLNNTELVSLNQEQSTDDEDETDDTSEDESDGEDDTEIE